VRENIELKKRVENLEKVAASLEVVAEYAVALRKLAGPDKVKPTPENVTKFLELTKEISLEASLEKAKRT
jgi:hypothetical protein